MPLEQVKFSFYRIDECGYYCRGQNEPVFGTINEILTDLRDWGRNLSIENTKLYDPVDGSNYLSTYLFNISQSDNNWLLTTWNETPATEAGVASVIKNSRLDAPGVVMNSIQPNSIPGYATYFWFLPERNIFASVRFQKRTQTGQPQMRKYIESALSLISSYVRRTELSDGTQQIVGYAEPTQQEIVQPQPQPRFRTSIAYDAGDRELIRQNASNISKIFRKETLKLNHPDARTWWQSALNRLGISSGTDYNRTDDVKVKYEISPEFFDLQQVDEMIRDWDESEATRSDWDDYGFGFVGSSSKPHWLSHSTLSAGIDLDVVRDNEEVVNAETLLQLLMQHKSTILRQIREEE